MLVKLSVATIYTPIQTMRLTPLISRIFPFAIAAVLSIVLVFRDSHAASMPESRLNNLSDFNALYQDFLRDHLSSDSKQGLSANFVDYPSVKNDERLHALVEFLERYPKAKLETREQKVAFYLNAYNILAIEKVTQNWPLMRLRSLGNFLKPVWTHPVGDVCGETMTLRKLEHEILRRLDEPRIHFGLNCASMSCPDLRAEPYVAEKLEQQLEEQTEIFLSQQGKGFDVVGQGQIKLSPIFDWFAEDFEGVGGVEAYVNRYLPKTDEPWEIVGYLEYNWDVNCHLTAKDRRQMMKKKRNTWFD